MTRNQIEYFKVLEQRRANQAQEYLTKERDVKTNLAAMINLSENQRHNLEVEAQARENLGIQHKTAEAANTQAAASWQNALTNLQNARTQEYKANIDYLNAQTNQRNAATNERQAENQYRQSLASLEQAAAATSQAKTAEIRAQIEGETIPIKWYEATSGRLRASADQYQAQTQATKVANEWLLGQGQLVESRRHSQALEGYQEREVGIKEAQNPGIIDLNGARTSETIEQAKLATERAVQTRVQEYATREQTRLAQQANTRSWIDTVAGLVKGFTKGAYINLNGGK